MRLEDSIIRIVAPPWNGARSAPSAAALELASPAVPVIAERHKLQSPALIEGELASAGEVQALEEAGVIQASPVFEVMLGKTYYRNGFFNVPVKFSGLFPEHGTEISIYCGDPRTLIHAIVDRKANQANHTPRVYGRASLANWFGRYKQVDHALTVRVVSANEIELG